MSGTPKNARKYSEAVSSSISRSWSVTVTTAILSGVGARLLAVAHRCGGAPTARSSELLAADGRMSFTDLGKATGLSTSAVHQRVKRLEAARPDHWATAPRSTTTSCGLPLTAFISIRPIDPSQPDDSPDRLAGHRGDRVAAGRSRARSPTSSRSGSPPRSHLEDLLARIRAAANVSTRTTIVLSTPYENRPVTGDSLALSGPERA